MKLKIVLVGVCALLLIEFSSAQSNLHIPKEIQKAYKNGTRSTDGKPGLNYWQNEVDYTIDVKVTPASRAIEGKEKVNFKNNSPDDLSSIVIRLYYDVFKKGNQRGMAVNENDIGEGVEIRSLVVNGTKYELNNPRSVQRIGTNLIINLPEPLASGKSISMEFEWMQKVPLTVRRTGAIDSTSFFIAYWYPQVSRNKYENIRCFDQVMDEK